MQNFLDDDLIAPGHRVTSANKDLLTALARRERYLAHHPHLRTYQAEIDRVLDKSGNIHGRMAVLGVLMQGKLLEMQRELCKLNRFLQ